jgi:general secretion pathway protein B
MSLILDALKKSEQERRRDKGPDLQTIHQPALIRAPQRSYRMAWVALLVSVNIAVLAYWWQQRTATSTVATATPLVTIPAAAAPAAAPPPAPAATISIQPATHTDATANAEYTRITPANPALETAPTSSARIEEVDELPEDVRNNLPAMTFSFHVYSSNPQQRTIIINNRRMREGEEVNAGLLLQEITEDGVVLLYAQHRIHISVLSGW